MPIEMDPLSRYRLGIGADFGMLKICLIKFSSTLSNNSIYSLVKCSEVSKFKSVDEIIIACLKTNAAIK